MPEAVPNGFVLEEPSAAALFQAYEIPSTSSNDSRKMLLVGENCSRERPDLSLGFVRWRPSFHLVSPHGWLNDPCGPGYDPLTGKYHLAFQWNPNGNDWGGISWGHATSPDLVSWKTSQVPCLTPSASYDHCGVFTGCFRPTNIDGKQDGALTYIYTSVNRLPIHYTLPYVPGSETLSIAVSHDGGETWERQLCNPILPGPPSHLRVTGWRDPFITSKSQHLPLAPRGSSADTLYGFISGGIVERTPTVFAYQINANDLSDWRYIGHLIDVGLNLRPSRWSGDFGLNWEVANFMTLTDDDGTSRHFIIVGTEGCLPQSNAPGAQTDRQGIFGSQRIPRSQLWMSVSRRSSPTDLSNGSLSNEPLMQFGFAGIFDHGCLYACNSFWDPISGQRVAFGWITEEDLSDNLRYRQNWSGLISLPRIIRLTAMHKVKRARSTSDLGCITSIEATPDCDGTYTVRTLGIFPDPRLETLRTRAHKVDLAPQTEIPLLESDKAMATFDHDQHGPSLPLTTSRWELKVEIVVGRHCSCVGLAIGHDPDFHWQTILYWNPAQETFYVERPQITFPITDYLCFDTGEEPAPSSKQFSQIVNHAPEVAPHTLFTFRNTATKPITKVEEMETEEHEEPLRIQAFYDASVLEIFVNDRTVISTRIFIPDSFSSCDVDYDSNGNNCNEHRTDDASTESTRRCYGIRFFARGLLSTMADKASKPAIAVINKATVWDGLEVPET